jgi:hypothetical protein
MVLDYCRKDLPGAWHVNEFAFIDDVELRHRLGRAYYAARYVGKLMGALQATGDELHAFVKFQILQYASIYEAVVSYLLWSRYKEHAEVKILETHKAYKPVEALSKLTAMKYGDEA